MVSVSAASQNSATVNLARYFHTLRHLRPIQVYGRAWQRFYRPRADRRPAPPLRPRGGQWTTGPARAPQMLGERRFRFLNETRELDLPAGWSDSSIHRLWLFNLHYFEDLIADDHRARGAWHRRLVADWLRDHQGDDFAGPAWVPYVVSVRIVNWIKWSLAGETLFAAALDSLALQARYLSQRIETHLLGNHLLTNAKALIFAGMYFAGDEAERWMTAGLQILKQQLAEQILADGAHYEQSPMYHALVLEDLLDLLNLAQVYPAALPRSHGDDPRAWIALAASMRRWLAAMTLPDGEISLMSDAAHGIAPRPAELDAYAARLGLSRCAAPADGITRLAASGYIRLQRAPAVAILDVGEIGPAFLPGHGHADVLSFELALWGQRVIVDSGTSVYYGNDRQRQAERSTAAHNTIEIEGQDSSEMWDNFRVARRAYPRDVSTECTPAALVVTASHDGYRRLPGRVTHTRRWSLSNNSLSIDDTLTGSYHQAIARFHLHPDARVVGVDAAQGTADLQAAGHSLRFSTSGGRISVAPTAYHPGFGLSVANQCLVVDLTSPRATHALTW